MCESPQIDWDWVTSTSMLTLLYLLFTIIMYFFMQVHLMTIAHANEVHKRKGKAYADGGQAQAQLFNTIKYIHFYDCLTVVSMVY